MNTQHTPAISAASFQLRYLGEARGGCWNFMLVSVGMQPWPEIQVQAVDVPYALKA